MLRTIRRTAGPAGLALLALAGAAQAGDGLHPRDLSYPELRFQPVRPEKRVTSQGVTLILMEDHELPTVTMTAMWRAGDAYDAEDKVGLAEMTALVARTGGAGKWSGDELDEALDNVAASLSLSTGTQAATLTGRCLTKDVDLLLESMRGVLVEPRFAEDKVEVARARLLDAIKRQNDEPSPIARRELKKIVYGADSPWARTPTAASVRGITRDDLVRFHRRYYRPHHLLLGVAGDIDVDAFTKKIEELFVGWPKGRAAPDLPAPTSQAPRPGVYLVKKEVNQTTVRMGHLGLPLLHPDYPACQVLNRILGLGTFTSRMGIEIRSNRGLAYSVGSGLFEGRGPGMFIAVAGTKAESTHEVTTLMKEIIAGMGSGDVTDEELSNAKSTLLNQWVFEFDSVEKVVGQKVEHEFYSYPADYLEEYPKKIAAVTKEDVVRCARKHLRPAELSVFLVGDPAKMGKPVEELGPVTEVELPAFD